MKTLGLLSTMGIGGMLAMPVSAAIVDDFESYTSPQGTEHFELRQAWIDQTTFPDTGNLVYLNTDPAYALSGSQSMELARHNNNGVKDLSSVTSGLTPLVISASVMLHNDGDGTSANLNFQGGADTLSVNTRQAHVGLSIGDTIKYRDDGVIQDTGITVVADQWYDISLIMKPNTDETSDGGTFDVIIDGVQVATDALFWHDKYKLSSAVRFSQHQPANTDAERMFIDDFSASLVPEPASLALLGGAIGAGLLRRPGGRSEQR